MIAISKHFTSNKTKGLNWIDSSYQSSQDYQIYHKPTILAGHDLVWGEEESISFPFLKFHLQRYNHLTVSFLDEDNSAKEVDVQGFEAIAFQQSQQQLQGEILLDWRINQGNISFHEEAAAYFPKTTSIITEYVQDLKKIIKNYPKLVKKADKFLIDDPDTAFIQSDYLPFESDFYKRLFKHYKR